LSYVGLASVKVWKGFSAHHWEKESKELRIIIFDMVCEPPTEKKQLFAPIQNVSYPKKESANFSAAQFQLEWLL